MTAQLVLANHETRLTRRRYDRIAPIYDALEWMMEWRARRWRRDLWSLVGAGRILEMGVGTGKNIRYYPEDRDVVAMDISEKMLARARRRAQRFDRPVRLELGDAQALSYPDASFDVVVATFLFCSVPDPVLGLAEAKRVLKPGGQLLLLEHVLSRRAVLRQLMQWLDPIPFHIWGAHIDRDTVGNVRRAGFVDVVETNVYLDIVKRIEARIRKSARAVPVGLPEVWDGTRACEPDRARHSGLLCGGRRRGCGPSQRAVWNRRHPTNIPQTQGAPRHDRQGQARHRQ